MGGEQALAQRRRNMNNLSRRVDQIEKRLEPDGGGKLYPNIWDGRFAGKWPELAEWAMGHTDERPDFWPSEEQATELRRRGYVVESREQLRETFEMLLDLNRKRKKALARMGFGPVGGARSSDGPVHPDYTDPIRLIDDGDGTQRKPTN
jgi:hypothetical protein